MPTEKNIKDLFSDIENGPLIYVNSPEKQKTKRRPRQMKEVIVFPVEDEVYMPYAKLGIRISNPDLLYAAQIALYTQQPIFIVKYPPLPKDTDPMPEDDNVTNLIGISGTVGMVKSLEQLEDGQHELIFMSGYQAVLTEVMDPLLTGVVKEWPSDKPLPPATGTIKEQILTFVLNNGPEFEVLTESLEATYHQATLFLNEEGQKKIAEMLNDAPKFSMRRLNMMIQNSPISPEEAQQLLEITDIKMRIEEYINLLIYNIEKMKLRHEMATRTAARVGEHQREDFLRQQIQTIQDELGTGNFDEDYDQLRERAAYKKWSDETLKAFDKELRRLMRYNPTSPEYALQYTYLDTMLNLPWDYTDSENTSLSYVREILERDHYGLEKVKERIVEQMAVIMMRHDLKAPILCLYGPPGVGKTSLGKSIAEAMGRKYVRVALGGVHDESEIRGHRRTYLGSMPGRIIAAMEKAGTCDPVIVLDEVDKIGKDHKGDPSTALLEVLDPEQNNAFHDNYLDHDYDLSKVLFIATANDLSTISTPLLDRMEVIEIGSYVEAEKVAIAIRHLVDKSLKATGFEEKEIGFTEEAIKEIIRNYTRESGVRNLEKKITAILRKIACLKMDGKEYPKVIEADMIEGYLGKHEAEPDQYEGNDIPGVVTGLAWTRVGGEILYIESSLAPGKGNLTLTGNLGQVMQESAKIALQFLRANADKYKIEQEKFEKNDVHIHVPEGATPKDGPSAGIAMLTSLASSFTGRRVAERIAMTGEFTLRGRVLPVGGVKEKILAAKRAGIITVILSEKNRKDIEEINPQYIEGMTFHYVKSAEEVLDLALLPE